MVRERMDLSQLSSNTINHSINRIKHSQDQEFKEVVVFDATCSTRASREMEETLTGFCRLGATRKQAAFSETESVLEGDDRFGHFVGCLWWIAESQIEKRG